MTPASSRSTKATPPFTEMQHRLRKEQRGEDRRWRGRQKTADVRKQKVEERRVGL